MRASQGDRHISGAEGLYNEEDIEKIVKSYLSRALNHDRGKPSQITITIEELNEAPLLIESLPVYTIDLKSNEEAWNFIKIFLKRLNISEKAIKTATELIHDSEAMRGASILTQHSSRRLEHDLRRGVRATRLGITNDARSALTGVLEEHGLNRTVVLEAIVLASKVAHAPEVVAELCVSDDPNYTTGYVASHSMGYLRIPEIKIPGSLSGGRVFFVKEDTDVESLTRYLETTPVLVHRINSFHGIISPDEALGSINN